MRRDRQHSGRIVTLIPYFRCVPDYPTPVGNARTTCHRRIATSRTLPDTRTRQTLSTVWERGIHGAGSRGNALGSWPLSSSIISVRTGWKTSDDWQGDDRDSAYFVKPILVTVLTSDSLEVTHDRFKGICHKSIDIRKPLQLYDPFDNCVLRFVTQCSVIG